jgi:4,5-DOPA dioxygenase extradiol
MARRLVLQGALVAAADAAVGEGPHAPGAAAGKARAPEERPGRMPVLFLGHGSPMNAIEDNAWSRAFRELGRDLPRPRAVLAISAHWYVAGTFLTGEERPRTIHDFGGFPRALYEVRYPAPGDPALASRVAGLLGATAGLRDDWGLDHGAWSVLRHLFPAADVPVVQLSLDARVPPRGHLEMGRALAPLRDEGVLVLASGNVTHNLRMAFQAMAHGATEPPTGRDASTRAWAEPSPSATTTSSSGRPRAPTAASPTPRSTTTCRCSTPPAPPTAPTW